MSVFKELYDAFVKALEEYKQLKTKEGKKIPERRIPELDELSNILRSSNSPNYRDAVLLRRSIANFVAKMDVRFLAFVFSSLDSDLRKKLNSILDNPAYDEITLTARERAEAKQRDEEAKQRELEAQKREQLILTKFNEPKTLELANQVEKLTEALNQQKNHIEQLERTIQSQTQSYGVLKTSCNELTIQNSKLSQDNTELKAENKKLTEENSLLQARVAQLEANSKIAGVNYSYNNY